MSLKRTTYAWFVMVVPLIVAALWLVSGHEVLTKHEKAVTVAVQDPLFGDTSLEQRFVAGRIFGYYVGLDLVIVSAVVCAGIALGMWLILRHRANRTTTVAQKEATA